MKFRHKTFHYEIVDDVLTVDEVQRLKMWCEAMLSPKSEIIMALEFTTLAMKAFISGSFVRTTSKEHWSMGFEVPNDQCLGYDGDGFYAIYDPSTQEIDVYQGEVSARIDIRTGAMVLL
jgi:hypothetical protein